MKNLILTGWGWLDYACAAALALRHHRNADVFGMSMRRLPEFLHDIQGYQDITLLGIDLESNPALLETALVRLAKNNVAVRWISALPLPDSLPPSFHSKLETFVAGDGVTEAASLYYKLPCADLAPLLKKTGQKHAPPLLLLTEAAMYDYRNYQDEKAYGDAIRHIANNDPESRWSESERRRVERYKRYGSREIVGSSPVIVALREYIKRIAPHDRARVLIYGESGTGKETVALQLHLQSPRRDQPFIPFNCANINPTLLESRFLGYEKGAFTGASERKPGLFEMADGGTLFLDEIGELPLEAQGILLRVIEEGRFMRVGEKEEVEVDVRLIAATHRHLPDMVRDRLFREDLFHRLNVIQLRTPALREHLEDIGQIVHNTFMFPRLQRRLEPEHIEALKAYDYPGNVRELINLLERAHVLGETDFAKLIAEHKAMTASISSQPHPEIPNNLDKAAALHVRRVYEKHGGNILQTAKALGKSPNTVRKHLATFKN